MEPLLANIAANPELVGGIRPSATSTEGVAVFLLVLVIKSILFSLGRWWNRLRRFRLVHLLMDSINMRTILHV
jgi:hypothetical protein